MIYEIRTYGLKVGSLGEVEKRFGEAIEHRQKYSPLAAFWHTEIGPLNEIIHMWPYHDHEERAKARAAASKDANWPPKIQEYIVSMTSEILTPFPFSPEVKPGKVGPIFEMRYYNMKAGTAPGTQQRWEAALPARAKLSPLVLVGTVDHGEANRFIHIWAYESLDQRGKIRNEAREKGIWPPPGGGDTLLAQANKIMLPAKFSPLQ